MEHIPHVDKKALNSYSLQPPDRKDLPDCEGLMRRALALASQAENREEIPVGAILISPDGTILGQGYNQVITTADPTAHAEIQALRAAAQTSCNYRLPGSILVVTLEPCLMCVGALIQARVQGVIYGTTDSKTGCLHSHLSGGMLPWSNHHFWAKGGVLAPECSAILRTFFQRRRHEKKQTKISAEG